MSKLKAVIPNKKIKIEEEAFDFSCNVDFYTRKIVGNAGYLFKDQKSFVYAPDIKEKIRTYLILRNEKNYDNLNLFCDEFVKENIEYLFPEKEALKNIVKEFKNKGCDYIAVNCARFYINGDVGAYYSNRQYFNHIIKKLVKISGKNIVSLIDYTHNKEVFASNGGLKCTDEEAIAIFDSLGWEEEYFKLTELGVEHYKNIFNQYIDDEIEKVFIDVEDSENCGCLRAVCIYTKNFSYTFDFCGDDAFTNEEGEVKIFKSRARNTTEDCYETWEDFSNS